MKKGLLLSGLMFFAVPAFSESQNLTGLASNTESPGVVLAIRDFQAESYLGRWFEIARIPFYFEKDCIAPVTADYSRKETTLAVTNQCKTTSGESKTAHGEAYFNESFTLGRLRVTFIPSWLRFTHLARGDYWILYTDYQYSLVGSPDHRYLWILARSESPNQQTINFLLKLANQQGFDTKQLVFNYPLEVIR